MTTPFPRMRGDHLVLRDLGHDTPIEGRRIDLAPVLVHDVEVQPVADDEDVLHRADRVGVVAAAAHDAAQPVSDEQKREDLLVHAQRAERAAIHVPTTSAGRNALNGPGCQ